MEVKAHETTSQRNSYKRMAAWAFIIAMILTVPFVANAPWTGSDFVFAGVVLLACAAMYEFTTRNMIKSKNRVVVAAAILFFIFMVIGWAASGP